MRPTAIKSLRIALLLGSATLSTHAISLDGGTNAVYDGISTNDTTLTVGEIDNDNVLILTNGASVSVETSIIGELSDQNLVQVTGSNSILRAEESLKIGPNSGKENRLEVKNGGQVVVGSATGVSDSIRVGSTNEIAELTIGNGSSAIAENLWVGTAVDELGSVTLSGSGTELIISDTAYIGEFGSNNVVTVNSGSSLTVSNLLQVGSGSNSNNALNIRGETIIAGSVNIQNPDSNKVNIKSGGKLTYTGDANLDNAADNGFNFESGSTLEIGGGLTFDKMDTGVSVVLNNDLNTNLTSSWNTGSEDMYVGDLRNNNNLTILNGASATAGGASAYIGKFSDNNSITVEGSNSTYTVAERLIIGAQGSDNVLNILEGGSVTVGTDLRIGLQDDASDNSVYMTNSSLHVMGDVKISEKGSFNEMQLFGQSFAQVDGNFILYDSSRLNLGPESSVTVQQDYTQFDGSYLDVTLGQASAGITNLIVGGDASFASNSTIRIFNDGTLGSTNIISQTIVSASAFWAGTNQTTELTTEILNGTNMVNFVNGLTELSGVVVTNDSILLLISTRSIAESSGLVGTDLEPLGDEIDFMATQGFSNATAQISILDSYGLDDSKRNEVMLDYYGAKESSLPAHNVINLGIQNVADQVTMRADNTRARQGMASASLDFEKPEAANGPHQNDQELQGWINAYGSKGSMSATDGYRGYDASLSGFLIGADAAFNENWLVGLAGGSGSSSTDKNSARMDTKTIYGTGYASVGTKEWFSDMGFIYGKSDVDAMLGNAFDTSASYSSQNLALFAGGGKEIAGNYLIFTPQLSFLGNFYMQKAYTETSSNAVGRQVDSMNSFNLQSTLGTSMAMYLGMGTVTLKPELRAFWLHEWAGDEEKLNYSLIGGTGSYSMLLQAPEKDILKLGIGTSAKWGDYLELRADLDTRLGSNYRDYTLLGSLRYQF